MKGLEEVIGELRAFVAEREWEQFHDPKNLAMAVASEAGELLAEYRWVSNAEADSYSRTAEHRRRISAEAADVGIALLLLCDRIGLDLIDAIRQKLELNRRSYPVDQSRGRWQRP
jgi:NTP pyrophosphatase (non-canonical NTP hydrolase)